MGAFEEGSTFLAGVLAKLPEGLRAQAKAVFEAPEAKDAITVIGDGALARPEFSRHMDDLKKQTDQLAADRTKLDEQREAVRQLNAEQTRWYEANKAALTEYPTLKARVDQLGNGDGDGDGEGDTSMTADEVKKLMQETIEAEGRGYINVAAWFASQATKHARMFNEDIDMQELANNPKVGRAHPSDPSRAFSLIDAYQEKYGDKVAEKAKAADEEKFNKEVERRLQEERAKGGPAHPFPLRTEPSVLDALTAERKPSEYTVDTAVAEYERLQQARQGSGA